MASYYGGADPQQQHQLQQQLQGLSVASSSAQPHYPSVPPPAVPPGYPASYGGPPGTAYAPATAPPPSAQAYSAPPPPGAPGAQPPTVGEGWTAQSVQPAAPGSHHTYGHLQYAPSFNTAAAGGAAAAAVAGPGAGAAPGGAAPDASGWLLAPPLPPLPPQQLVGPMVRFNDFDPASGMFDVSVLVVQAPSLAGTMQLHWAVNGPAVHPAASSQVLDDFMGYKFWRFDVSLQLLEQPSVVNYLVGVVGGQAPLASHCFNLPARWEPWRFVMWSCNGFHEREAEAKYGGIAHLWNDLLTRHASQPYHLQIGGGDQLYCDHVFELPSLKPWLMVDDPHERARVPFTPRMLQEVEQFYMGHYCGHFATPAFAQALASVPFTFSWDDHDVFDGWGSYPDYLQQSAVFQGIFAVARRFYLLFQQHCRYDNATSISRTIGEFSYHQVRSIGHNAILLAPDTRSERTTHQVLPPQAWDVLLNEVTRRLAAQPGAVQHLLVLLPVPIVYPKIPITESLLSAMSGALGRSKAMRDAIGKLNLPSSAVSAFNEPDLLDDLLDHWSSADHLNERTHVVRRLQALAQAYSVRVTFLSGDVHVGAFGCFQGHPKQPIRVVDPKFMLQVISSAIGNEPPPAAVVTLLETTSCANTSLGDTLDKMIRALPDKKKLKGARNYCEVLPLHAATCAATGTPQPPGGLSFTLRCEAGPPGRPTGIETITQVAPVLLTGPKAAEAAPYANAQVTSSSASGVLNAAANLLPGDTGKQVQAGLKTLGHKVSNVLMKF